jgi:hypothetical protein
MQKERFRPKLREEAEFLGFYAKVRTPEEIQLLRRVSQDLGWPSNASLLHLLAQSYLRSNGEVMS